MNGVKRRMVGDAAHVGRAGISKREPIQSHVDIVEEDDDDDTASENDEVEDHEDEEDDNEGSGSEIEASEDEEEVEEPAEPISGWADSMAKILGSTKPKNKKNLILSRAKKDYEVLKTKEKPIPSGKGTIEVVPTAAKKSKLESSQSATSLKVLHQLELELKRKEKEWENINRVKPDPVSEKPVEKELVKIATKGVVQLFNAVSLQQKTIKSKLRDARRSEFKKDKVLNKTKEIFDSAMEKSRSLGKQRRHSSSEDEVVIKDEEDSEDGTSTSKDKRKAGAKKPAWQALHDDYMLDAKMKDWDRSSSDEDSDGN